MRQTSPAAISRQEPGTYAVPIAVVANAASAPAATGNGASPLLPSIRQLLRWPPVPLSARLASLVSVIATASGLGFDPAVAAHMTSLWGHHVDGDATDGMGEFQMSGSGAAFGPSRSLA